MRSWRRLSKRGQAAVETALIAPILILFTLGAADLGRAYYLNIETSGASRAGMRQGILGGAGTDIGTVIRAEPNTAIKNDDTTWGQEGPNGTNSCAAGKTCGDANGCSSVSSFSGVGQLACFAVRTCTYDNSNQTYDGGCTANSGWTVRPASSSNSALQVKVVYLFTPTTPLIASFANGGKFYLTGLTTGVETY